MENRCFELCFYFSKVTSYFKLFHVKFPKTTAMLNSIERAGMNQLNHYSALTGPVGPLEIQKTTKLNNFTYQGEDQSRVTHHC